ncbi:MAG: DUF4239 domain-containing protein [bacterium]
MALVLFLELGRKWGRARMAVDAKGARAGVGGVEAAIYGLFGLLLAFSFSGAAGRFDQRRHLIVEEANDLGTAYLRLDLLPAPFQEQIRPLFRAYLNKRLEVYQHVEEFPVAHRLFLEAEAIGGQIWRLAVVGCRQEEKPSCSMLLLSALNATLDIANTRLMATQEHPPAIIFWMLIFLGLVCCLMAGFAMAEATQRNMLYSLGFALIIAVTCYLILDLEYPRLGFMKVESYDEALRRVLEGMR